MSSTQHEVFALDEIEPSTARRVKIGAREIAIVRIDDAVYAIGDVCSHADVSLSEGFVEDDDCALECPRHGSQFDLKTGEPLSLPAVRKVPVYEVAVVDGQVVVTLKDAEDKDAEESE